MDARERAIMNAALESATQITVAAVSASNGYYADATRGTATAEYFEAVFKKIQELTKD